MGSFVLDEREREKERERAHCAGCKDGLEPDAVCQMFQV